MVSKLVQIKKVALLLSVFDIVSSFGMENQQNCRKLPLTRHDLRLTRQEVQWVVMDIKLDEDAMIRRKELEKQRRGQAVFAYGDKK